MFGTMNPCETFRRRPGRRLVVNAMCALGVGLIASSCGDGADGARHAVGGVPAASCRSALEWMGHTYYGDVTGRGLPATGAAVAPSARQPACDDTNNASGAAAKVSVRRLVGVSPEIALRRSGDTGRLVFLIGGVFTALPGHPLHRAFWGSRSRPYRPGQGRRCEVRGRVDRPGVNDLGIADGAGEVSSVAIDARTVIDGAPRRGGQPFLRQGATARVVGRRCTDLETGGERLTAVRVTVLG